MGYNGIRNKTIEKDIGQDRRKLIVIFSVYCVLSREKQGA